MSLTIGRVQALPVLIPCVLAGVSRQISYRILWGMIRCWIKKTHSEILSLPHVPFIYAELGAISMDMCCVLNWWIDPVLSLESSKPGFSTILPDTRINIFIIFLNSGFYWYSKLKTRTAEASYVLSYHKNLISNSGFHWLLGAWMACIGSTDNPQIYFWSL